MNRKKAAQLILHSNVYIMSKHDVLIDESVFQEDKEKILAEFKEFATDYCDYKEITINELFKREGNYIYSMILPMLLLSDEKKYIHYRHNIAQILDPESISIFRNCRFVSISPPNNGPRVIKCFNGKLQTKSYDKFDLRFKSNSENYICTVSKGIDALLDSYKEGQELGSIGRIEHNQNSISPNGTIYDLEI